MSDHTRPMVLLTNGVVVPRWLEPEIVLDGAVAWSGDRIVDVGNSASLRAKYPLRSRSMPAEG